MNKKKITRNQTQSARQIMGLLSALTPGLQQVEGQLKQVAEMGPTLQTEWEQSIRTLQGAIEELRERHDRNRTTLLTLIYLMASNNTPWLKSLGTIEEFYLNVEEMERKLYDNEGGQ